MKASLSSFFNKGRNTIFPSQSQGFLYMSHTIVSFFDFWKRAAGSQSVLAISLRFTHTGLTRKSKVYFSFLFCFILFIYFIDVCVCVCVCEANVEENVNIYTFPSRDLTNIFLYKVYLRRTSEEVRSLWFSYIYFIFTLYIFSYLFISKRRVSFASYLNIYITYLK